MDTKKKDKKARISKFGEVFLEDASKEKEQTREEEFLNDVKAIKEEISEEEMLKDIKDMDQSLSLFDENVELSYDRVRAGAIAAKEACKWKESRLNFCSTVLILIVIAMTFRVCTLSNLINDAEEYRAGFTISSNTEDSGK